MEIDKQLERVNGQMPTYRPDSELSRFNATHVVNINPSRCHRLPPRSCARHCASIA